MTKEERTCMLPAVGTTLFALCILCLAFWNMRVAFSNCCSCKPPLQPDGTFHTHLGRDSRYMSINATFDEFWDVYLEERLGHFSTPHDAWARGRFSMFHQLRCLASFRSAIQKAANGQYVGTDFHHGHWAHCLDFMRQVVLCNADDTVERPRLTLGHGNDKRQGIEGVEEVRICRSFQPMCDVLAVDGLSESSCIPALDVTIHPWYYYETHGEGAA